jgi:hypothetical protein
MLVDQQFAHRAAGELGIDVGRRAQVAGGVLVRRPLRLHGGAAHRLALLLLDSAPIVARNGAACGVPRRI